MTSHGLLTCMGSFQCFVFLRCPAPFALILEDDTNVALVSYGQSIGTPCGDYTGDSVCVLTGELTLFG